QCVVLSGGRLDRFSDSRSVGNDSGRGANRNDFHCFPDRFQRKPGRCEPLEFQLDYCGKRARAIQHAATWYGTACSWRLCPSTVCKELVSPAHKPSSLTIQTPLCFRAGIVLWGTN